MTAEGERRGPAVPGRAHWLCVAALAASSAVLAAASLMPVGADAAIGSTPTRQLINNLLHVPAYGVLAGLWAVVLTGPGRRAPGAAAILGGAALAVVYGGALEVLQIWVPGRFCGLADVGLNSAGAGAAALVLWRWSRRRASAAVQEGD